MPNERAARLAELVKSAIECGPEERSAFLDQECRSDPAMRAEIESLLQQQDGASRFIEKPALRIAAESLMREGAFRADQIFGDYEIISLIGSGGMGEVYLAEDRQLHRKVALKLIRCGMDSEDIVRHFKREEHLLASLNHPNISQLYGGGVSPDGIPFFAMEYVGGQRLDEYCDERGLGTKERLQLFRKVCTAVTYAHQHLVIHRDLKPANIHVTIEGEPKLLDFGIAKLLNMDSAQSSGQTLTLQGVMTPDYASPEQVRGETMTTASDIYSLGVVLYKLLTGQSPYRTKTNRPDEIARAITEQEPMRPSTAIAKSDGTDPQSAIRNLKSLRGDLDNVILMALRKEPSRRYSSVGQFSADIQRHLHGLPVIARRDTFAYRASKFIGRNRVGVAAAATVLLAILVGLTVSIAQTRVARHEKAKAEGVSNFLQTMLLASDPASTFHKHKDDPTVKDVLDEASKRLAAGDLSNQPEVKAELQRIIGASYVSQGQYDLGGQNLTAALEAQTKIYGGDSLEALKTLVPMGEFWLEKGEYAKADDFYRQKLSILRSEQKRGTISADYLIGALYEFALLRRAQGDSKQAETLLREDLALSFQGSPITEDDIGSAKVVLPLTLADQGKFDEAERMLRANLASIRQQTSEGGSGASLCAGLTILGGSTLIEQGELAEAEEDLREAEAIYRKLYNHSYMPLGDNLRLQAQLLYLEHKYAEAEAKINETLKIYRETTGPQYMNYATALTIQGLIYGQTGRTAEAEKLLREAVGIRAQYTPETHFLRATANGALGEFLTTQKRFAEAEPLLLYSYESLKKSQSANSPRTRTALQRLVDLYEKWQKPDLAAKYRTLLPTHTP